MNEPIEILIGNHEFPSLKDQVMSDLQAYEWTYGNGALFKLIEHIIHCYDWVKQDDCTAIVVLKQEKNVIDSGKRYKKELIFHLKMV